MTTGVRYPGQSFSQNPVHMDSREPPLTLAMPPQSASLVLSKDKKGVLAALLSRVSDPLKLGHNLPVGLDLAENPGPGSPAAGKLSKLPALVVC
jgi:hypothetical protein